MAAAEADHLLDELGFYHTYPYYASFNRMMLTVGDDGEMLAIVVPNTHRLISFGKSRPG